MKIERTHVSGSTFIVIAASLWALDGVLRRSLYSLPPLTIVFYEHLVGLLLLLIGSWIPAKTKRATNTTRNTGGVLSTHFTKKSLRLGAAVGLLSGLIGTLAFTAALQQINFIPFSVVLLLQKLTPIFAGLTAVIFLKEKISRAYLLWAIGAMVAAYFVTFPTGSVSLATSPNHLIAAGLAVLAAASWGSSTTISKLLLQRETAQRATLLRFGWTIIWSVVAITLVGLTAALTNSQAVAAFTTTTHHCLTLHSVSQVATLVTIALSTGMVGVLLYYRGLKTTPVLVAIILELIFPVLAVLIDMFLYQTILQPSQYVATVVMLFCVYMTNQKGLQAQAT